MSIGSRLVAVLTTVLLGDAATFAQLPTAPPPHLALDEFVREYKRLGLPLPAQGTELMRVRWQSGTTFCLGFGVPPAKSGGSADYLVGLRTNWYYSVDRVKNGADALRNVEPVWVVDLLCTAAQCRARGLNEIAEVLYARGLEATAKPMPPKWGHGLNQFGGYKYRADGWKLHVEGDTRSAHLELRHAAFGYWHGKIMAPGSDRREVLRYLRAADLGFHPDVRDLERTVAPRKSKPGTAEALIDDLTEFQSRERGFGAPTLVDPQPGEAAYWKLAEMGFDAVPALLDHIQDSRFTRQSGGSHLTGGEGRLNMPTHVGQLARYLVCHFADESVRIGDYPDPRTDTARAWWEKARKMGEEKWLVALALSEARDNYDPARGPDRVVLHVLGVKYPNRLAEIYRTVLRERTEIDSWALVLEIVASKLPRAEQLALLTEGAEHKRLVHRNSALAVLAKIDPPLFRKHLLATLKRLPPDATMGWVRRPQGELAALVWKTDDPACWDALATAASWAPVDLRIEIIRDFDRSDPKVDKSRRRESLRFLLEFLSDDSATKGDENRPGECVRDVVTEVLAGQLKVGLAYDPDRGPFSRLFILAAVAKAAEEELARLKK